MSRLTRVVCDYCGKDIHPPSADDMMNDKRKQTPISIQAVVPVRGNILSPRVQSYIQIMAATWVTTVHEGVSRLDFCNTDHLVLYIESHQPVLFEP